MLNTRVKKRISNLLIIALFAVIISPLCHLKSADASFIEICTAAGIQRIAIEKSPLQSEQEESSHKNAAIIIHDKCPICLLSKDSAVLPDQHKHDHYIWIENEDLRSFNNETILQFNLTRSYHSRAPPQTS